MKFSKYILLVICICSMPILSNAQKVPGFQGKRGIIEAGASYGLLSDNVQWGGLLSYALNRQVNIGLQYDITKGNGQNYENATTIMYGISYQYSASKYTLAPYGRFWTTNIGILQINSKEIENNYKGYYCSIGFFDRSIWNRISLAWGSDVGFGYAQKTVIDPNYSSISDNTLIYFRVFIRVGLAW